MDKHVFFATGSAPRPWGEGGGSVRDLFKLNLSEQDYLVRFGDASIEQGATVFTPYPGKRRFHVVLDQGGCEYQGAYTRHQYAGFDVFDFDASQPIRCACARPGADQRVLNVIHPESVRVELSKQVLSASGSYAAPVVASHQIDFLYFLFDPDRLAVQAQADAIDTALQPYSTLLLDTQKRLSSLPVQLVLQQLTAVPASLDVYHFRLILEQEESYVTQTYSAV